MPKKFKGENSKSAVARERKSAVREAEERDKRKKEEDEYWRDDDKHVVRKQGKKVAGPFNIAPVLINISPVWLSV